MSDCYRLGIDIGGTFTDFTLYDQINKEVIVEKVLTSSIAPEKAVLDGVEKLAKYVPNFYKSLYEVIHATTLITNVILERKGDKTGLITTEGFKDILELRREVRYDIYDMFIKFPPPLVPRELRCGVEERILASGQILKPLNRAEVKKVALFFKNSGVQAISIAFLHSYKNNSHELEALEIVRNTLPNIPISLSHQVVAEPKEYERFSTTTIDAYVKSTADKYLEKLVLGLKKKGFSKKIYVMLSNGGTATVETAKSVPIQMVESGPAAGVEAACFFGGLLKRKNLLSFDMGGTTAKLCIVENGSASKSRNFEVDRVHRFKSGSGLPAVVPVYDLLEIGAGGGSIARLDDLNLFKVGPDSSGSNPGPACYGNKGNKATVTDADLLLGYLNPDYFLGGEIQLNLSASEKVISDTFSKKTKLSPIKAAAGIHEIVNENMASAARVYIGEKGKSASDLSLIAFGGAGPVHAVSLAKKLGINEIIIPPMCGVMSSLGLLTAPVAFEKYKVVRSLIKKINFKDLEKDFSTLEEETMKHMDDSANLSIKRCLELRYSGQDFPLEVFVKNNLFNKKVIKEIEASFTKKYEKMYGKVDDENPIEIATIRVNVIQKVPKLKLSDTKKTTLVKHKSERKIYELDQNKIVSVQVFERSKLANGQRLEGPAIIEEKESTTLVKSGTTAIVHETGCLIINIHK